MMKNDNKLSFTKSSVVFLLVSIILSIANVFCIVFLLDMTQFYSILWLVGCATIIFCAVLFFCIRLNSWLKLILVSAIIITLVLWGYYAIILLGLKEIFSSAEALQEAVASTGAWGMSIYILIQFLQVTFIPLPAMVTTLAGTALFGPLLASVLSFVGIMLGSIFAFWLGDRFGEKICIWIAGREATDKYSKLLYEKGKYLFFLMMLFPLFPDDILCLIAGMTAMSFRYFMITILLTRPIGIVMTCYLGSGQIIPYSGWGLVVWAILIILMACMFIVVYRFQPQIENFLGNISQKLSKKDNHKLKLKTEEQPKDGADDVLLLPPPNNGEQGSDNNIDKVDINTNKKSSP